MGRLTGGRLYVACVVLLAIYTLGFAALAEYLGDPHMLNRGGALLSAAGAVLVIVQVLAEERFAAGNEQDRDAAEDGNIMPAFVDVARRVAAARSSSRELRRMRIVVCIAMIVVVGEVLHGWGDKIIELAAGERACAEQTVPD